MMRPSDRAIAQAFWETAALGSGAIAFCERVGRLAREIDAAPYADCCDTPSFCSSVRRCTAKDAAAPEGAPEAYTSHQGSTCIDWDDDPKNQLSIIAKDGRTTFAAYHHGQKAHGAASGPEFMAALRRFAGVLEGAQPEEIWQCRLLNCDGSVNTDWFMSSRGFRDAYAHNRLHEFRQLYTAPPSLDAEDAARLDWLESARGELFVTSGGLRAVGGPTFPTIVKDTYRAAIDAARAAEGKGP